MAPHIAFFTLDPLLLDFTLAFVFFVALLYSLFKPRFGEHRSVVAMAVTVALALAVGLVWWEREHAWSVRDLGPLALLLVLLLVAAALWRAFRGHGWAMVAVIAVLAMLAMAWLSPRMWPEAVALIQTILGTVVVLAILAFLWHLEGRGHRRARAPAPRVQRAAVSKRRAETDKNQRVGKWIGQSLKKVREDTARARDNPKQRTDVLLQIRRMLPAQGWLTTRMARLREQAHLVRNGHLARLKECRAALERMPVESRQRASVQMVERYRALVGLDTRLERLDKAVAECELRIKQVTQEAETAVSRNEFPRVHKLLKYAEALQKHNSHLFKKIDQTERVLGEIVRDVLRRTSPDEQ